jgi:hypothetical protein
MTARQTANAFLLTLCVDPAEAVDVPYGCRFAAVDLHGPECLYNA